MSLFILILIITIIHTTTTTYTNYYSYYYFSPLDMESWLKLFIPDTYKLVCRALGCSETSTIAQIEAEIAITLQTERNTREKQHHPHTNYHHSSHINSHIHPNSGRGSDEMLDSSRYSVSSKYTAVLVLLNWYLVQIYYITYILLYLTYILLLL